MTPTASRCIQDSPQTQPANYPSNLIKEQTNQDQPALSDVVQAMGPQHPGSRGTEHHHRQKRPEQIDLRQTSQIAVSRSPGEAAEGGRRKTGVDSKRTPPKRLGRDDDIFDWEWYALSGTGHKPETFGVE